MSERFPHSVYGVGDDPDPRFTMANERTFLAWIRTSLAAIAGGVALEAFALPLEPRLKLAASLLLLALGAALPWAAWRHWKRTERAMRCNEPLPSAMAAMPLAVGVGLVGVLVVAAVVLR